MDPTGETPTKPLRGPGTDGVPRHGAQLYMDAEQVNQDGAQDALDAGLQNTSDDARREPPAVDGAARDCRWSVHP